MHTSEPEYKYILPYSLLKPSSSSLLQTPIDSNQQRSSKSPPPLNQISSTTKNRQGININNNEPSESSNCKQYRCDTITASVFDKLAPMAFTEADGSPLDLSVNIDISKHNSLKVKMDIKKEEKIFNNDRISPPKEVFATSSKSKKIVERKRLSPNLHPNSPSRKIWHNETQYDSLFAYPAQNGTSKTHRFVFYDACSR